MRHKSSGSTFRLEDWADRIPVPEQSPAMAIYCARAKAEGLPQDGEVVYGKIGAFGHCIHDTELEPMP